jgi:CRP-like cAMP-binding protein
MRDELSFLFDLISKHTVLSQSDKKDISSKIVIENFDKGDLIVKEGQVCKSLSFVVSGIYRVHKNEDGKEITSYFSYESRNQFVASFTSLLTKNPSNETIECIDGGKLLSIAYSDWNSLYKTSHALNTFGRKMAEFNYLLAIERIESLQYQNATDRYESFIKLYPNLLNLIPHHYIASYLGITPESLSRIRKSSIKK